MDNQINFKKILKQHINCFLTSLKAQQQCWFEFKKISQLLLQMTT